VTARRKIRGRWYVEPDRYGSTVLRPNKTAAGMTRQGGFKSDEARTLSVRGTLDSLAGMLNWSTQRSRRVCRCCGQRVLAVVLSDRGRAKLARLRRARGEV
jgi:hypothetical protein